MKTCFRRVHILAGDSRHLCAQTLVAPKIVRGYALFLWSGCHFFWTIDSDINRVTYPSLGYGSWKKGMQLVKSSFFLNLQTPPQNVIAMGCQGRHEVMKSCQMSLKIGQVITCGHYRTVPYLLSGCLAKNFHVAKTPVLLSDRGVGVSRATYRHWLTGNPKDPF
jgi:hypothetical protein